MMPKITVISPEVISTTVDEDVIFEFQFSSPNVGIAQAYLEISGTENRAYQMTLKRQGNFTGVSGWNLGKFPMGTYSISMYIVDAGGMYATMDTTCVIRSGSLTLSSDFVSSIDYYVSSPIIFPYHVQSISDDPITIHYQIDYISCLSYPDDQERLYRLNHEDQQIPRLDITGDLTGINVSGAAPKEVSLNLLNYQNMEYSLELSNCLIEMQGTSSTIYPVINYTIHLLQSGQNFYWSAKEGWIPECRYTLKAN